MSETNDSRKPGEQFPWYVVMRDSALSGWGKAPGTSYYCLACRSYEEAEHVAQRARARPEMKGVRIRNKPPQKTSLDHLSIRTPDTASAWYG